MTNLSPEATRIAELEAELQGLREDVAEVLAPFADAARQHAADAPEWNDTDRVIVTLSIGDLRAALRTIARED